MSADGRWEGSLECLVEQLRFVPSVTVSLAKFSSGFLYSLSFKNIYGVGDFMLYPSSGLWSCFLDQKRAMGLPSEETASKHPFPQNEQMLIQHSGVHVKDSPDCAQVPRENGQEQAVPYPSNEESSPEFSKSQDSWTWEDVLFIHFRTESPLISFEGKS